MAKCFQRRWLQLYVDLMSCYSDPAASLCKHLLAVTADASSVQADRCRMTFGFIPLVLWNFHFKMQYWIGPDKNQVLILIRQLLHYYLYYSSCSTAFSFPRVAKLSIFLLIGFHKTRNVTFFGDKVICNFRELVPTKRPTVTDVRDRSKCQTFPCAKRSSCFCTLWESGLAG